MSSPDSSVSPRVRERDVVVIAAKNAIDYDERDRREHNLGLTKYGIAHMAASLAMVLSDPRHPNHLAACEQYGLEPRPYV